MTTQNDQSRDLDINDACEALQPDHPKSTHIDGRCLTQKIRSTCDAIAHHRSIDLVYLSDTSSCPCLNAISRKPYADYFRFERQQRPQIRQVTASRKISRPEIFRASQKHRSTPVPKYLLTNALEIVFEHPERIAVCFVDGTRADKNIPQAGWHAAGYIDPTRDGALLPVFQTEQYDVGNRRTLARLSNEALGRCFEDFGYLPLFIDGEHISSLALRTNAVLQAAFDLISIFQANARRPGSSLSVPQWPVIVLRCDWL